MKITILGSGCIWTKRACASFLVNDNIIVDPGTGTLKQLLKSSNKLLHHEKIEKIKLILITHYHIDHYFDIVLLMWKLASDKNPNASATIICPPGGEERIKTLCKLGMSEDTFNKLDFEKYITFIDASTLKDFEFQDFKISSVRMDHGNTECFGYILKEKNKKTIAFSGDSTLGEGMQYMIDNSDLAFIDMAGTDISDKHYNIIDGIELMKAYKDRCIIVPSHLTSQARDYCIDKIIPPDDLMVLNGDDEIPYDFEIKRKPRILTENFEFEIKRFKKISGEIIDLNLSLTKRASGMKLKYPTYCFDVVLHNSSTKIGTLSYSVLPDGVEGHIDNVSFDLFKNYDLKSVKYECCQLVKNVALYHESKVLYLTCPPRDFKTRKVFESLGAYLKEIKTYTFMDKNNRRNTSEQAIWVWEI